MSLLDDMQKSGYQPLSQKSLGSLGGDLTGGSQPPQSTLSPFSPFAKDSQFVQPTPSGATKMQYQPEDKTGIGQNFSLGAGIGQTAQSLVSPLKGGIQNIKNVGKGIAQDYRQGGQDILSDWQRTSFSPDYNPQTQQNIGTTVLSNIGTIAKMAFSPITQTIGQGVQDTAQQLAGIPIFQNFANSQVGTHLVGAAEKAQQMAQGFTQQHPEISKDIGSAFNVAQLIGGGKAEAPALGAVESGLTQTAEAVKPGLASMAETAKAVPGKIGETATGLKETVGTGLEKRYVGQEKAGWTKPATINKPGFKTATGIYEKALAKGHDIGDTLVKKKLNLADHIEDGRYSTKETVDMLHQDAMKSSNEMLRPSLEKANPSVPRTPVKDLLETATENIKKDKSLTSERKDLLIEGLNKAQQSLEKKYPQGMQLTDLHDEKIVRDMNAKYSPVGDIATNNEAVKNKALADASRETLNTKAPKELGVPDFNAELSKQHETANYLEALNGKKAPVSTGAKIRQTAGKVMGAAVGHGLGGGVLGGVGGYHIGGMVESMLENIPNPLKNHYLENLQVTNPEAFSKVQGYLKTGEVRPVEIARPADLRPPGLNKNKLIPVKQFDKPFQQKYIQQPKIKKVTDIPKK